MCYLICEHRIGMQRYLAVVPELYGQRGKPGRIAVRAWPAVLAAIQRHLAADKLDG